jgi:hypothetical protein
MPTVQDTGQLGIPAEWLWGPQLRESAVLEPSALRTEQSSRLQSSGEPAGGPSPAGGAQTWRTKPAGVSAYQADNAESTPTRPPRPRSRQHPAKRPMPSNRATGRTVFGSSSAAAVNARARIMNRSAASSRFAQPCAGVATVRRLRPREAPGSWYAILVRCCWPKCLVSL